MILIKKIQLLFCLSLVISVQQIYAESLYPNNNDINGHISLNNNLFLALNETNNQNVKTDTLQYEHPLRRFEITFFISAPFTFIISFLSLSIYDTIIDSYEKKEFDSNVNVWKEYPVALLVGTIGLSTAIASREAWICMKMNKDREKKSVNDQNISITITKYF